MKTNTLLILLFPLFNLVSEAQVNQKLETLFKKNKKGIYVNKEAINWLNNNSIPKERLFHSINEKSEVDVLFFYYLVNQEILINQKISIKQDNVYFLVDKGLSSSNITYVYTALNYLLQLPLEYFNSQSISKIAALVTNENTPYLKKMIRLCGKLGINDLIPYFKNLLNDESTSASVKWSIKLAIGRMGDIEQVKECLNTVKQTGLNDQVITYLIPDLLYMNNRLCFDYILQQILVDEKKCTTTDPDNEQKISCAYRLMELIAPYIKDFPVELYETGDIISDDYEKTLLDVRNWILSNNYLYQLN